MTTNYLNDKYVAIHISWEEECVLSGGTTTRLLIMHVINFEVRKKLEVRDDLIL